MVSTSATAGNTEFHDDPPVNRECARRNQPGLVVRGTNTLPCNGVRPPGVEVKWLDGRFVEKCPVSSVDVSALRIISEVYHLSRLVGPFVWLPIPSTAKRRDWKAQSIASILVKSRPQRALWAYLIAVLERHRASHALRRATIAPISTPNSARKPEMQWRPREHEQCEQRQVDKSGSHNHALDKQHRQCHCSNRPLSHWYLPPACSRLLPHLQKTI